MRNQDAPFRPLPPALFVTFVMMLFGLSEAHAIYRVATEFDIGVVLRIVGLATLLGAVTWATGFVASRLPRLELPNAPIAAVLLLAGLAVAACAGEAPLTLLIVGLGAAIMFWVRATVSERAPHGALSLWPLWLVLLGVAFCELPSHVARPLLLVPLMTTTATTVTVAIAVLIKLSDRARAVVLALACGSVATLASGIPWVLPTHYPDVKMQGVLFAALTTGSALGVLTSLPSSWRPAARSVVLCGILTAIALPNIERATAYGPFPVRSFVGAAVRITHTERSIQRRARFEASCPADQTPAGVVMVMLDTVRADHFNPQTHDLLADWSRHSTTFSHAYAPGTATYTAFATWMPRRPDSVGVGFRVGTNKRGPRHLEAAFGEEIPAEVLSNTCAGEGAAFVEGLEPGALNLLYLSTAHAPYYCESGVTGEQCYAEAVDCATSELEAVFEWAKANPEWAVVVTSDHGEAFGEKHVRFHSGSLWEEQIRVPLSVRAPGFEPGRIVDTPVSNASLAGSLGCWLGDDPAHFGGADAPLSDTPVHAPLVAHSFATDRGPSLVRETAIIDWPYKLIIDRDTDYERLHDLVFDPSESINLAASLPHVTTGLRRVMPGLREAPSRR